MAAESFLEGSLERPGVAGNAESSTGADGNRRLAAAKFTGSAPGLDGVRKRLSSFSLCLDFGLVTSFAFAKYMFGETCGGTNIAAAEFEDWLDFCWLGARPAFSLLGAACGIESITGTAVICCAVGQCRYFGMINMRLRLRCLPGFEYVEQRSTLCTEFRWW